MLTQSCIILAIVAYLALMIIIGISFSKKNNSTDDFYLGGRKLGPIVTAMSAEASDRNIDIKSIPRYTDTNRIIGPVHRERMLS